MTEVTTRYPHGPYKGVVPEVSLRGRRTSQRVKEVPKRLYGGEDTSRWNWWTNFNVERRVGNEG